MESSPRSSSQRVDRSPSLETQRTATRPWADAVSTRVSSKSFLHSWLSSHMLTVRSLQRRRDACANHRGQLYCRAGDASRCAAKVGRRPTSTWDARTVRDQEDNNGFVLDQSDPRLVPSLALPLDGLLCQIEPGLFKEYGWAEHQARGMEATGIGWSSCG